MGSVSTRSLPATDVDFADEGIDDVHAVLRELRSQGPAWRVRFGGESAVLLLSYDLVHAAFADEQRIPAATFYRRASEVVMGRMVLSMMDEEHRINRAIMTTPFRPKIVSTYLDLMRATAEETVDAVAPLGAADLAEVFTSRYPMRLIARLLGLPEGHDEELARWGLALIRYFFDPDEGLAARDNFTRFLTPIIEDRRREPRDDLISMVVHTEVEGQRPSDEAIRSFIRLLFPAGADTTYMALGNTILTLFRHPEWLEVARTQPDRRRAVIEESLRCEPSTAILPRMTPADRAFEWAGIPLEPSTPVLLAIMAANRDPDVYHDPDVFDPTRTPEKPPLTFGFGTHFCIGNHLALAEMSIGLGALLERLPNLRLQDGADARTVGTVLRGPNAIPVRFDPPPP